MTTTTQTRTSAIAVQCILGDSAATDHLILTPAGGESVLIDPARLSSEVLRYATLHGLKQKLVDAAAISRDPETGRSATVADKLAAVQDVLDRLLAGEWNKRRESGPTGGVLLRALMRLQPAKSREDLVEWLGTKSDAEKAALRRNPKVAAIIAEIQAEDGSKSGVDSDALLEELGD